MKNYPDRLGLDVYCMVGVNLLLVLTFLAICIVSYVRSPERERRAYEAGRAEADRKAAAAGGWSAWIAGEVKKVEVR